MLRAIYIFFICLRLVSGQSCEGRCNDSADSSYACQCNIVCDTYKDCCSDYIELCAPEGSCAGRCSESFNPNNVCHCTPECVEFNNCCLDYSSQCTGAVGSCAGRCNDPVDANQPCQCNSACLNYGDCCSDYSSQCEGTVTSTPSCPARYVTSTDILNVSLELFDSDVDRIDLSGEIVINEQDQTSSGSNVDNSPNPFFTYVNPDILQRPSYNALVNLLDNYEKFQGINEVVNAEETFEQDLFLDLFMSSAIGQRLYQFFYDNGLMGCPTQEEFKENLRKMWFEFYSRQNNALDTSGFEHVFVGEIKSSEVSGFHSWVQFYLRESVGDVNYYGYVSKIEPQIYGMHFTWEGYMKPIGGGAIGFGPGYELAVFTLCHVVKPDSQCSIQIRNEAGSAVSRSIQTWTRSSGSSINYVASAYFLS